MWTHTVLEIYQLDGEWPDEGEPAKWIEQRKVMWCQADDELVIYFMPFWKVLAIKLMQWNEELWRELEYRWSIWTPWGRRKAEARRKEFEAMFSEEANE